MDADSSNIHRISVACVALAQIYDKTKQACGYVDESYGPACALWALWTNYGQLKNQSWP